MTGDLRPRTKIATGGFLLTLLASALFFNGWVFSTSLQRYAYLIAATVVSFVVAALLLVDDLVAR